MIRPVVFPALGLVLTMSLVFLGVLPNAHAQDTPRFALTQVTQDVWRFRFNRHVTMVVDAGDSVVIGDPINATAAPVLREEIEKAFGKPVSHMIFSHHHGDHASGGTIFDPKTTVVAHDAFARLAAGRSVEVPTPDITFTDEMALRVGEKTFELAHVGEGGHSDDMIVTIVRPDNVAFVVDIVSHERLPYRTIPGRSLDGLIAQIEVVEGLDFEILLPGHGQNGTKRDATESRLYLQDLRAVVRSGLEEGRSRDEIVADAREQLVTYADWLMWDQWLPENVDGMIAFLKE